MSRSSLAGEAANFKREDRYEMIGLCIFMLGLMAAPATVMSLPKPLELDGRNSIPDTNIPPAADGSTPSAVVDSSAAPDTSTPSDEIRTMYGANITTPEDADDSEPGYQYSTQTPIAPIIDFDITTPPNVYGPALVDNHNIDHVPYHTIHITEGLVHDHDIVHNNAMNEDDDIVHDHYNINENRA
ncbi:hypothetical protein WDU94_005093 [Cyamophila willieti]